MARKTIGAITLLSAKKYWTCRLSALQAFDAVAIISAHLRVRDTEKGQLQQEVQEECDHSTRSDTLVFGDMVRYSGVARPNSCEQNSNALAAGHGLDTVECQRLSGLNMSIINKP